MPGSWLPRQDVQVNGGEPVPTPDALDFRDSDSVQWDVVYDEATGAARITATAAGGAGVSGEDWFPSAKAATAAALPAYLRTNDTLDASANGAFPAIDGAAIGVGEDFALKDGAALSDNGIYVLVTAGSAGSAWSATRRADWASESTVTSQARIPIEQGTTYGGRVLRLAVNDPFVVNVSNATLVVDSGLPNGTVVDQIAKWAGSSWIAGALNLAAAAAVTGVLGLANGGTGLSATPTANTVLTGTGAAAAWSDAPTVTSLAATSHLTAGSGTKATAGEVRFPSAWSIQQRNAEPGSADRNVLSGTGEGWTLGAAAQTSQGTIYGNVVSIAGQGACYLNATVIGLRTAAGAAVVALNTGSGALTWDLTTASPLISQADHATTGHTFTVQAQNVTTGTGSTLLLKGGTGSVANGVVQAGYAGVITAQFGASSTFLRVGANYIIEGDGTTTTLWNGGGGQIASLALGAGDYIKLGAIPSATGAIRVATGFGVFSRNNANTQDFALIQSGADDGVYVGATANNTHVYLRAGAASSVIMSHGGTTAAQVTAFYLLLTLPNIQFVEAAASPNMAQAARTTDAGPQNLTLTPQAPWASATGANRTPGSLIVALSSATNSGTTVAGLKITKSGAFSAQIGPYNEPATYSAVWLGPGLTPSTTNFAFLSNGASLTYLNVPGGGTVFVAVGGASTTSLGVSAAAIEISGISTFRWEKAVATPTLTQATQTTDAATNDMSIQAQSPWASATTNNKGAKLWLKGGNTGTGEGNAPGSVWIGAGATTVASFEAAQVSLYANYLEFRHNTSSPEIRQQARQSDLATHNLLLQAQSAYSGATTNKDGGHVVIKGGARYTSGFDGGVQLKGGDGTTIFQVDMGSGARIGFYGATPAAKPTVTGSRGGNAALASLLTALSGQGLLTDSSS